MNVKLGGLLLVSLLSLTGCDYMNQAMGVPTQAESRAIGSSCRQVGRSLEDCYARAPKANKADIYAGWKEMDGYMRDNNIPTMPMPDEHAAEDAPASAPVEQTAKAASAPVPAASAPAASSTKPADHTAKADSKGDAKH